MESFPWVSDALSYNVKASFQKEKEKEKKKSVHLGKATQGLFTLSGISKLDILERWTTDSLWEGYNIHIYKTKLTNHLRTVRCGNIMLAAGRAVISSLSSIHCGSHYEIYSIKPGTEEERALFILFFRFHLFTRNTLCKYLLFCTALCAAKRGEAAEKPGRRG